MDLIIIDDSKREVTSAFSTNADGNLQEHGGVVYLGPNGCRLEPGYLEGYLADIEEVEALPEPNDPGDVASTDQSAGDVSIFAASGCMMRPHI